MRRDYDEDTLERIRTEHLAYRGRLRVWSRDPSEATPLVSMQLSSTRRARSTASWGGFAKGPKAAVWGDRFDPDAT